MEGVGPSASFICSPGVSGGICEGAEVTRVAAPASCAFQDALTERVEELRRDISELHVRAVAASNAGGMCLRCAAASAASAASAPSAPRWRQDGPLEARQFAPKVMEAETMSNYRRPPSAADVTTSVPLTPRSGGGGVAAEAATESGERSVEQLVGVAPTIGRPRRPQDNINGMHNTISFKDQGDELEGTNNEETDSNGATRERELSPDSWQKKGRAGMSQEGSIRLSRLSESSRVSRATCCSSFVFQVSEEWTTAEGSLCLNLQSGWLERAETGLVQEAEKRWGDVHPDSKQRHNRCVTKPDSRGRSAWACLCTCLILYDVVMVPMVVFDYSLIDSGLEVSCICTLFWTADIVVTFLTGFDTEGLVELRLHVIARRYMRTWLTLDVVVVSLDWLILALDVSDRAAQGKSEAARFAKGLRAVRFVRIMRIVRCMKLAEIMRQIVMSIRSESVEAVLNMCSIILLIFVFSHYIACGWYAVGNSYETSAQSAWTRHFSEDESIAVRYSSSMHWSMCQFTPATVDIHPHNVRERIFAICVVVVALVVFSSFVGSISAKITVLRQLKSQQLASQTRLRQYMSKKRISLDVGHRVWSFLRMNPSVSRRPIVEADVALLLNIPKRLRIDFRTEVYMPHACFHPVFSSLAANSQTLVSAVCDQAMTDRCYSPHQDVFIEGEEASSAYFVSAGIFCYETQLNPLPKDLAADVGPEASRIVSEAILWGEWVHCGNFSSKTPAELVVLNAQQFRKVATRTHVHAVCIGGLRSYATLFAAAMRDEGGELLTDIVDADVVCTAARGAFPEDDSEGSSQGSAAVGESVGIVGRFSIFKQFAS